MTGKTATRSFSTQKSKRLPLWLQRDIGKGPEVHFVKKTLRKGALNTVCEEARCPNLAQCFKSKQATFLILGAICTRDCGFCSVTSGHPEPLDSAEPKKIVEAARALDLSHIVLTSVTRDDLVDGGAGRYAQVIRALKKNRSDITVEALTPDFNGDMSAVDTVCDSAPDVYNHNMETVDRLYAKIRPGANYSRSLALLQHVKKQRPSILTKSGLMLGFGETRDEIIALLRDLKKSACDFVTIGQYMRPTKHSLPVHEYVAPPLFDELAEIGRSMGFKGVFAGPLVRSSFNAALLYRENSG